jgi:RES domain
LLKTRTPEGPLYRIARGTESWEYPDWKRAGTDLSSGAHTFGSRFDDFDSEYRVLYASSQLVSCYVELLARFRADYTLVAELEAMDGEMITSRLASCLPNGLRTDL